MPENRADLALRPFRSHNAYTNLPYDMKVGLHIALRREEMRLTRKDLAMMVNYSTYVIGRVERGEIGLKIKTLSLFAKALECSIDYLIPLDEHASNSTKNKTIVY